MNRLLYVAAILGFTWFLLLPAIKVLEQANARMDAIAAARFGR